VVITRASNNYGPYQFPEKLIPLMIANAMEDRALPVYGDGMQVRDWLYVEDHCRGILAALREGPRWRDLQHRRQPLAAQPGGGAKVLALTGKPESLIEYVTDRPGHDRRYALSSEKLMRETGWRPVMDFETGLKRTIEWYRANSAVGGARAERRVSGVLRAQLRGWRVIPRAQPGAGAVLSGRRVFLISDQPFRMPPGAPFQPQRGGGPRNSMERRWWLWGMAREMKPAGRGPGARPGFRGALYSRAGPACSRSTTFRPGSTRPGTMARAA
jgi:hypothetical protein